MMAANMTNFTDIDSIVPLVEFDEDDDKPVYIGFIESGLAKVIPKFFRAIVTLLICGLLLGLTFFLIFLWKRGCRKHRKSEANLKGANGSAGAPLHSVVVTPPTDDLDDEYYSQIPSSSSLQPVKSKHMNIPKQNMLRRASGPFGSEALSFVGEQYQMKKIEKESHQSHHLPHHHRGHGAHIHSSGSSTGGDARSSTPAPDMEETKSKWSCFKGNKE